MSIPKHMPDEATTNEPGTNAIPARAEASLPPESTPESTSYQKCSCLRCGLGWKARNPQKRPSSCPRCGSSLWDQPPQRKGARHPDDPPNPNWKYRLKPIKRRCPTCKRPWTRLTVAERLEQEEKNHAATAEARAYEHPARPSAVTASPMQLPGREGSLPRDVYPRRMTPPPGLHDRSATLSEELKEGLKEKS